MNIDNLIHMANQIGTFFESMPDRQQAQTDIATHLKRFWEPRMRSQILAYAEQPDHHQLKDIVAEAILNYKNLLS